MIDDGRLLVLLATLGLVGAAAARGSRGLVRPGRTQAQPRTIGLRKTVSKKSDPKNVWELVWDPERPNSMDVNGPRWSDSAIRYDDGRIAYDFPERVPDFVKRAVARTFEEIRRTTRGSPSTVRKGREGAAPYTLEPPGPARPWADACQRCQGRMTSSTGSRFNTEQICRTCEEKEEAHPAYAQAVAVELQAVKSGDYNFPGIGLPSDLRAEARARGGSRKTGSRAEVRKGRNTEKLSLVDRLAWFEKGFDLIAHLGDDGLPVPIATADDRKRWSESLLHPDATGRRHDGGIVFAVTTRPTVRPRSGFVLLRSANFPQDGFLLYELERAYLGDGNPDSEDQSLIEQAEWTYHQLTRDELPGGTHVPLDSPLTVRMIGLAGPRD
jgi:hypothetical protein